MLFIFQEKERQLDYTNIYQRQIVLREKNHTSLEAPPKMEALPAPKKPKLQKKKANKNNDNPGNRNYNDKNCKEKNEKEKDGQEVNPKPGSFFLTTHSDTGSEKELDQSGKGAEKNDKQLSVTDGSDVSDMVMSTINKEKALLEDELANENERQKKEEFVKSLHEEEERLKKEKEEMERKKKEEEERAERKQMEREAKWQEDLARKEREEEERWQESARWAREEEERRKVEKAKEKETKGREDSFFDEDEESRKKKDLLLARLKAIDNKKVSDEDSYHSDGKQLSSGKSGDESIKSQDSRKSGYETRKADENLHNGLPALGKESDITSPPTSVKSDPDSIIGIPRHKPVLLGRGNFKKKPSSFSWLEDNKKAGENNSVKCNDDFSFGDYSPTVSNSKKKTTDIDRDIFDTGLSRKPGHGRRHEGGLGDSDISFNNQRGSDNFDKPKNVNNLPFLMEDFGNNEPLLPRRRRAQGRVGPAISTAFDKNLDDDIEELAL